MEKKVRSEQRKRAGVKGSEGRHDGTQAASEHDQDSSETSIQEQTLSIMADGKKSGEMVVVGGIVKKSKYTDTDELKAVRLGQRMKRMVKPYQKFNPNEAYPGSEHTTPPSGGSTASPKYINPNWDIGAQGQLRSSDGRKAPPKSVLQRGQLDSHHPPSLALYWRSLASAAPYEELPKV